jgi:hypothetical protein
MSIAEIKEAVPNLSPEDLSDLARACFQKLDHSQRIQLMERCTALMGKDLGEHWKAIERLLRRLQNPDIPEDVWIGFEDIEDGRVVDMETALNETPPPDLR